jgi:hypothetical protein
MTRFEAAIKSTSRWCTSTLAEVLLIAFVYGVGILVIWRQYLALDTAAWYVIPSAEGSKLTLAGIWYGYVTLPIFQFLLCRWYFRLFIWARFLWQVSRIKLSLVSTHPDRLGGLSFLSHKTNAFAALAVAHGTLLAGTLSTRVVLLGTPLIQFKAEIAVMVIFVLGIILAPLLVFSPQLVLAKRKGRREYGALAERYVREFDVKWLRGGASAQEPFMGSADIQSLADLANSYNLVQTMRVAPITKEAVLRLAVATIVPIVPLLLTMILLKLNDSERVTWQGRFRPPLSNSQISPRRVGKLPIWLGVGGNPESALRAGEFGLPLILANISQPPANFAGQIAAYRQRHSEKGHDASTSKVAIATHVHLAEDSQTALEEFYPYYTAYFRGHAPRANLGEISREVYEQRASTTGPIFVGSPQQIIDKLMYEHELFAHDRFLCQVDIGGVPYTKVAKSVELLATQVVPVVRRLVPGKARSGW